jgi:hypothetical protein
MIISLRIVRMESGGRIALGTLDLLLHAEKHTKIKKTVSRFTEDPVYTDSDWKHRSLKEYPGPGFFHPAYLV